MFSLCNDYVRDFHRELRLKVELPNPHWVNIACVVQLYRYPIMWGATDFIDKRKFTYNIQDFFPHKKTIWDGMFVVYDQDTRRIQTEKDNSKMSRFYMEPLNNNFLKFTTEFGHKDLILDLKTIYFNFKFECYTTLCDKYISSETCIDCGDLAAKWISYTFKNNRLRLGWCLREQSKDITFWDNYDRLLQKYGDEKNILMNRWDVPLVKIVSLQSAKVASYKVYREEVERNFMPNILISTHRPFEEHQMKWLKINDVILRNINPLSPDDVLEINKMPKELKWKKLVTYWEIYKPGCVTRYEEVYGHVPLPDDLL